MHYIILTDVQHLICFIAYNNAFPAGAIAATCFRGSTELDNIEQQMNRFLVFNKKFMK